MMLRKINAVISLVITVMLLNHAVFHALWMLSAGRISIDTSIMAWILFLLMMVHAGICIYFAISGHKGAEKRKCNSYANLNAPTMFQRISGILLIVFTILHIAGTVGITKPPALVHAILPPVFFAMVLMHTAVSTVKAFITLGIGNLKAIKVIDITMKVICAITLIADVIGFYLYI